MFFIVALLTLQEKNETAQKQLDALLYSKRQKIQKITENTASDTATISSSLESPGIVKNKYPFCSGKVETEVCTGLNFDSSTSI